MGKQIPITCVPLKYHGTPDLLEDHGTLGLYEDRCKTVFI